MKGIELGDGRGHRTIVDGGGRKASRFVCDCVLSRFVYRKKVTWSLARYVILRDPLNLELEVVE